MTPIKTTITDSDRSTGSSPTRNPAACACAPLGADRSTHPLSSSCCTGERKTRYRPPLEHDAYREGALRETGWRIHDWLTRHPDPCHQADVARGTGLNPGTVNRHLAPGSPLVNYGLVERNAGKIRAAVPIDEAVLDTIARDLGTYGHRAKHLAGLRAEYIAAGALDDDGYWIDRVTGERRGYAAWLHEPEASTDQPTRHAPGGHHEPSPGQLTSDSHEGTTGPGPEPHPTPLPPKDTP